MGENVLWEERHRGRKGGPVYVNEVSFVLVWDSALEGIGILVETEHRSVSHGLELGCAD